jgi:hypothetical protein
MSDRIGCIPMPGRLAGYTSKALEDGLAYSCGHVRQRRILPATGQLKEGAPRTAALPMLACGFNL